VRRALIAWAAAGAGDFSIDALKKEAKSLMIPGEKQLDYVCAQILRIKEHELELERKEAQKQLELELERKEAQKQLELELERKEAQKQLELERKEAQKQLELERVMMEVNITRTGILWKLKTQTQRHALELFLFDCWEKMQQFTEDEIRQIRLKNKRFPLVPANATVSDDICVML
jgi:multidrug efflux pump subunit AcrA (membrane-fusion protein)